MSATKLHCLRLLDAVQQAGDSPELAYLARTRLRRALIALERGPRVSGRLVPDAPTCTSPEIASCVRRLDQLVMHLCQPSEALDQRWRSEWSTVSSEIHKLRALLLAAP